jgi:hypothetical protein
MMRTFEQANAGAQVNWVGFQWGDVQRNLLPTMKAGFVGSGGLGSQRYAGALGQSMADIQAGLTGQQYGALSKGYSEALKGALDEAQLQNLTAGTQGKLAQTELDTGLASMGALTKAGAERQAYQQSLLDAPLKTATAASGLMRGFTVPSSQEEKFVGPKAGLYKTSDLANIMGVLSMMGSTSGGRGIQQIGKLGSGLLDGVGQGYVHAGVGSALAGSHRDGARELGEHPAAFDIDNALNVFDFGPFTVAGHDVSGLGGTRA